MELFIMQAVFDKKGKKSLIVNGKEISSSAPDQCHYQEFYKVSDSLLQDGENILNLSL